MDNVNFYNQVRGLLNDLFLSTGYQLDQRLTGYSVMDAVHVNIDPAMEAVVRTEHRISPHMVVDLRELIHVTPPLHDENGDRSEPSGSDNLFITFTAESAQFMGGNATAFGIHLTRVAPEAGEHEFLDGGIFVSGASVTDAYRMVVFLRTPAGEVSLAKTGVVLGLDPTGRLVSYQGFEFGPGLSITRHPPSSMAAADRQVMLYVFLTLTVFLMINQGEAPVRWEDEKTVVVG